MEFKAVNFADIPELIELQYYKDEGAYYHFIYSFNDGQYRVNFKIDKDCNHPIIDIIGGKLSLSRALEVAVYLEEQRFNEAEATALLK
jgi:hypothetical protein